MSRCDCNGCIARRKEIVSTAQKAGALLTDIIVRMTISLDPDDIDFIHEEMTNKHTAMHAAAEAGLTKEADELAQYGIGLRAIHAELENWDRETSERRSAKV